MKKLLRNVFPNDFFTRPEHFRALLLGVLYLASLLAQLFTFEKFHDVVRGYGLPGGEVVVSIVAWLLPLAGLMSLPFLLSMQTGKRLRVISRTAMVALPLFWLVIAVWLALPSGVLVNSGLFGATLEVPAGLWLIALALLWLWSAVLVARELPARR